MRKKITPLLFITLFIFMLLHPKETFCGASEGLLLWFHVVLPTLFPFLIISNLLITTNSMHFLTKLVSPILSPFFQISRNGTFSVVTGFLCGYPMGAKATADLLRHDKISKNEAYYLLSFCNNTSPAFLMNYVIYQQLHEDALFAPTLLILTLTPILLSFIFRRIHSNGRTSNSSSPIANSSVHFQFNMIDSALTDGCETILNIGGYIILFSVIIKLLTTITIPSKIFYTVFLPSLEITNGISHLVTLSCTKKLRYILILSLISFGGFCSIAQTKCMLHNTGLSIVPYIIEKLITSIVTSLFAILSIYIFHYI